MPRLVRLAQHRRVEHLDARAHTPQALGERPLAGQQHNNVGTDLDAPRSSLDKLEVGAVELHGGVREQNRRHVRQLCQAGTERAPTGGPLTG